MTEQMVERISYSREELIAICERSFVQQGDWRNRDTAGAQRQLGECYALLKAGCPFFLRHDIGKPENQTIWLAMAYNGYAYFEYGGPPEDETYYLPTPERLDAVNGKDWY